MNAPTLNLFATENGIGLEIVTEDNAQTVVLSPQDAASLAVNLITQLSIREINNQITRAMQQQEFENMRQKIEGENTKKLWHP